MACRAFHWGLLSYIAQLAHDVRAHGQYKKGDDALIGTCTGLAFHCEVPSDRFPVPCHPSRRHNWPAIRELLGFFDAKDAASLLAGTPALKTELLHAASESVETSSCEASEIMWLRAKLMELPSSWLAEESAGVLPKPRRRFAPLRLGTFVLLDG